MLKIPTNLNLTVLLILVSDTHLGAKTVSNIAKTLTVSLICGYTEASWCHSVLLLQIQCSNSLGDENDVGYLIEECRGVGSPLE